jgi:hypothetical protein
LEQRAEEHPGSVPQPGGPQRQGGVLSRGLLFVSEWPGIPDKGIPGRLLFFVCNSSRAYPTNFESRTPYSIASMLAANVCSSRSF